MSSDYLQTEPDSDQWCERCSDYHCCEKCDEQCYWSHFSEEPEPDYETQLEERFQSNLEDGMCGECGDVPLGPPPQILCESCRGDPVAGAR